MTSKSSLLALLLCGALVIAGGCGGGIDESVLPPDEQQDPSGTPSQSNPPEQSPPPAGSTLGACVALLDCTDQCPDENYDACEQGCLAQADAASKQLYQSLVVCWDVAWDGSCSPACQGTDENACNTCLDSACGAQLSACETGQSSGTPTNPPPTDGSGSCIAILDCADMCPDASFDTCEQGCISQADANAQQLYQALITCWDNAWEGSCLTVCDGNGGEACWTCLDSACSAPLSACQVDQGGGSNTVPPAGTSSGSCTDLVDCTDMCPDASFDACEQGCISLADANSQQLYQALVTCWDNAWEGTCLAICQGADEDSCWNCVDNACSAQQAGCSADI